jgi:hypothetical protein
MGKQLIRCEGRMRKQIIRLATLAVFAALAGCGSSDGTVRGTVMANGKPVEEGHINFMPMDDKNSTFGAPIENGKFSAKVAPGKYKVMISGGPKGKGYPKTQEEMKNISDKDLDLKDQVPDNATGNGQEVEVKKGGQELNITLEFPAK